ncbi:MAG: hypothetical protein GPJ54_00115 [Candidatus Heimdallarchaeota archaeon]|nr:hypothetical protein [Candidatus Heimdallarchaeota archaeon]
MHRLKFLTFFLIFSIFISFSADSAHGFEPDPEEGIIAIHLLATERTDIEVGSIIEVYIVIKNFSNFTMNNVMINQSVDEVRGLQIIESPVGSFNGTDRGYTEDVTVINHITGDNVTLTSFNVTSSNFTMSMDAIASNVELSFKFKINVTESPLATINPTTVIYDDKFGDTQGPIESTNDIEIRSVEIIINDKIGHFPEIEVDDSDNDLILLGSILLIVVAVLSRMLYKKKPIE